MAREDTAPYCILIAAIGITMNKTKEARSRSKSDVTVAVVRQNQAIDHMTSLLSLCASNAALYDGQRELSARSGMTVRVLKSSINMLSQNKLKLWMIDEDALSN